MSDVCRNCAMPEPAYNCWVHRFDCPFGKLPNALDTREAVHTLAWLLAEMSWKFNEHSHDCWMGHIEWGPTIPHWK